MSASSMTTTTTTTTKAVVVLSVNEEIEQLAALRGVSPQLIRQIVEEAQTAKNTPGCISVPYAQAQTARAYLREGIAQAIRERNVQLVKPLQGQLLWVTVSQISRYTVRVTPVGGAAVVGWPERESLGEGEGPAWRRLPTPMPPMPIIEASLPDREQLATENYRLGQTLPVYVVGVGKAWSSGDGGSTNSRNSSSTTTNAGRVRLTVSRIHHGLVRVLLWHYLDEEVRRAFEVRRVVREPGKWARVELTSTRSKLDHHRGRHHRRHYELDPALLVGVSEQLGGERLEVVFLPLPPSPSPSPPSSVA